MFGATEFGATVNRGSKLLLHRLADAIRTLFIPFIVNLQQQSDLKNATECPSLMIQRKKDLPLRITAPS